MFIPINWKTILVAIIVSALVLTACILIGIGIGMNSSQQVETITIATPTLVPTQNDGFQSFLGSFTKTLNQDDYSTLMSETDQSNFTGQLQCHNSTYNTDTFCGLNFVYQELQSGELKLQVISPTTSTCNPINPPSVYKMHSVMGMYNYNPTYQDQFIQQKSGYVVLSFVQPIENSSWEWLGFTPTAGQCPTI